jgi:hypothetical protein
VLALLAIDLGPIRPSTHDLGQTSHRGFGVFDVTMHMPPGFPIPDFPMTEINGPYLILNPTAVITSHIAISEFLLQCVLDISKSRLLMPLLTSHVIWHVLDPAMCHSDS